MIANLLTVSLVVVCATIADAAATPWVPPYAGVDPNSLSCDPKGQVFLLLPHFSDCNKYYICDHGKEVEQKCSAKLIFDFEQQTCNWDWATKCWLRQAEEEVEGSGSGEGEELEWAWTEKARAPVHLSEKLEKAPAPQFSADLDCSRPESAARLAPYKKDCQRYWRCVGGVPQTAYCTDGLFFNEQKQQCDFEANVKCDQVEELGHEFIVYK